MLIAFFFFSLQLLGKWQTLPWISCSCSSAESARTPIFSFSFPPPSSNTTITICPFLPFHALKQYPHPSHSNSTPPPPPPAPCSEFFFPWIFASHHADGPWALPGCSVFPPPPPAALLFHSKMASALEPLVSGCIFRLVVVSVSHGSGTFFSSARHEIPVSIRGSRMEDVRF